MAERLLTNNERVRLEKCLEDAEGRKRVLDKYVRELEEQLHTGVVWCHEPSTFRQMCEETAEWAAELKRLDEEREIVRYGRPLTEAERSGWALMPKEIEHEASAH